MLKRDELTCVDLFAGCGGLSLGLHLAHFRTIAFAEINKDAADTFEANLGWSGLRKFGDIRELTTGAARAIKQQLKEHGRELDLVTGGPPCQGYSGIGHRRSHPVEREAIPSNHLFKEMVRVIDELQPRAFLFENVQGLLTARWSARGKKGEVWDDVRTTFRHLRGYQVGWQLVHAKDYGVPQNRPRILLVGVRENSGIAVGEDLPDDVRSNPRGLIPHGKTLAPNLIEVLGDLDDPAFDRPPFETTRYILKAKGQFQNFVRRGKEQRRKGAQVTEQAYTRHSERVRKRFQEMHDNDGKITEAARTKKFAQRLLRPEWDGDGPTITATSLPDDFVHYSRPRILTVREWARLQTFPDSFQFCGPRTTGGHRRAGNPSKGIWDREVPKYTQIGNAVPVLLGRALGRHIRTLIKNARRS